MALNAAELKERKSHGTGERKVNERAGITLVAVVKLNVTGRERFSSGEQPEARRAALRHCEPRGANAEGALQEAAYKRGLM
jgi:hypothetical protein